MKKGLTILFLSFYSFFIPYLSSAQQTVGLFTKNLGQQDGYVLFSPGSSDYTYLIDKCGKLVHEWNTGANPGLDAYIYPNGNLLSTGKTNNSYFNSSGSAGGLLQIFNWNGKLLWSYAISDSLHKQDHDVYPMPNGNILVCEWARYTNAQAIAAGADPAKIKKSAIWTMEIQEIEPVGGGSINVVWQWNQWDHIIQDYDSTRPNYGVVADHPERWNINYQDSAVLNEGGHLLADWTHANAIAYNADLDQVMISSRDLSEIYIIDHNTTTAQAATDTGGGHGKGGGFLYRWGNPAAYNRGTKADKRLFEQHNASWIPDGYPGAGNISVFNDGDWRPTGNYSSADIIIPPVDANGNYKLDSSKSYGPDTAFWSYKAPIPSSLYSNVEGGAEGLYNGDVMICAATTGTFMEVDVNKNVVWKYVCPVNLKGPITQGSSASGNTCFKTNFYMENYPAFKNITLKPLDPIELNAYYYNCYMPYQIYPNPLYHIAQLKGYNLLTGVADSLNKGSGYIKGVVESQNLGSTSIQFSLIDSTGAITVSTSSLSYMPSIGDSVLVSGIVTQVNGLTEYSADTIIVKPTGTWQKKPDVVGEMDESNESDLIMIKGVWLLDTSEWKPSGYGFNVHITDGKDTFVMYINSNTDLFAMKAPIEQFNVTGIEIQDKPTLRFFGDYKIEPRGRFDLQRVTPFYKIKQVRGENSLTGVADSAGSRNNFYLKGIVQSPDFNSKGLSFSIKDSTGSIMVFSATNTTLYSPVIGDSVVVRGLLKQINGLTEVFTDSVSKINNSSPLIKPITIPRLSETYEAQLVQLKDYYLIDTTQWVSVGNGFNVSITNGIDTTVMHISSTTNLFIAGALKGLINITGIEIQNQPQSPYFGNYEIEPRGLFDIAREIQLYKIEQVRVQDITTGIADSAGSTHRFLLKGIVQSPDFNTTGLNFSIKDSTGSIIVVSTSSVYGYVPTIGDSIALRGLLTQVNGLTEVVTDSISILKNASPSINSTLVPELTESTEAQLVTLNGYYLSDTTQWKALGNGFDVNITNGTDNFIMHISSANDLFKMKTLKGIFNITGIEIQDQPTSPYIGNYEIEPRGSFDLQRVIQMYKISEVRVQDATNGIADSAGSANNFYLKGIVQSPDFSASGLNFSIKDNTGSIMVASSGDISSYVPVIGDSIELRGLLTQVNGLTEVVPDLISVLKNASPAINATIISTLKESTEAQLVKLNGYYLTDASQWKPSGNGFDVSITNSTDTFGMRIGSGTDLFKLKSLPGVFDITGVEIQDKSGSPYLGKYIIEPRGGFDLKIITQLYKIKQVRGQNSVTGVADSAGTIHPFFLKGIVQSPDFNNFGYKFSMKDSTGSIFVESTGIVGNYTPAAGDSIEIRGLLSQTNGLTVVIIDSISQLTGSAPVLVPQTITSLGESTEAKLVRYQNAWLVNPLQWVASGTGFSADITNGIDTIQLYISSATNTFSMPAPKGRFNITGIGSQNKLSVPYIGGYQLWPTAIHDFQFLPVHLYKIGEVKGNNALSGIADSINTYCLLKGVVQSNNLSGNTTEFYSLQDLTGAITLTSATIVNGYIPTTGDSVEVRGTVLQLNGLTHFATDSVSRLSSGVQLSAVVVTTLDENTESGLVTMNGYRLVDGTKWDTTGANGSFEVKAYGASDTITLKIVSGTDLYDNSAKPVHEFDVTGIGSQNDVTMPYLTSYDLIPRGISDIQQSTGIAPENLLNGKVEIYPNPASGMINIKSSFVITEIQITDVVGRILYVQPYNSDNISGIDLGSFKQGVYIVKIYNGASCDIVKILKD